jgi:hypothetical protein
MVDLRPSPTAVSFKAKLVSTNANDAVREFIVAFFVEDSSFSVTEKAIRNSGFRSGKFLQRTKSTNPDTGLPDTPEDVVAGTTIFVNGWRFHLSEAMEGSLKMMEAKSDVFARSDLSAIILSVRPTLRPKAKEIRSAFALRDADKRGRVKNEVVADVLGKFGVALGSQELVTLLRRFQFADTDYFAVPDFLSLVE